MNHHDHEVREIISRKVSRSARQMLLDAGATPANALRVLVTPKLAERLLLKIDRTHQRPVRRNIVEKYKKELRAGKWLWTGQGGCFSTQEDLLDGQHRLLAIQETGIEAEMLFVLDIDREAWMKLDGGTKRRESDVIGLQLARNQVAAALRFLALEESMPDGADICLYRSKHNDDQGAAIAGLMKHPLLSVEIGDDSTPQMNLDIRTMCRNVQRRVLRPPALALYCVYRTVLFDFNLAEEFWNGVSEGAGLERTDPRWMLRERLSASMNSVSSKLSDSAKMVFVIKAWDAFVKRRPIGLLRWTRDESMPTWPGGRASWKKDH